jgi:hypothetical protein
MHDDARTVAQASVQIADLCDRVGRPQPLKPIGKSASNDHSISPSLRRRDDNAAVSAEHRIGHRNLAEQNAFPYVAVGALLNLASVLFVKRPAARIEQA